MGATTVDTIAWPAAVAAAWQAGHDVAPAPLDVALPDADGMVLAAPLPARTDLPAFPTSSVDGYAVRGGGPWEVTGRILAGQEPSPLTGDGQCAEIATGAMVPAGTTAIVRVEHATTGADGLVDGVPRERPEWRDQGEEAAAGDELMPAGATVAPGMLGLAASAGHDALPVRPSPRTALLIFGDELLATGPPGSGRVRDALGPQLPAWLRRLGTTVDGPPAPPGADTLEAHVAGVAAALDRGVDLVCTTGGTMHGPVDHLHPALRELGAEYVVNTVAVRPGYPMLLAALPASGGRTAFLAGLPGNPQSAVVALMSLVAPLVSGWLGREGPRPATLPRVRLGAPVPGRDNDTHLALVRRDPADGRVYPVPHAGSAMLRGLARAVGFAVVAPRAYAAAGDEVPLLPLPLQPEETT